LNERPLLLERKCPVKAIADVIETNMAAMQWRNVISGGPRFKLFEGHPSRSAKGTSRAPYMHEFSSGSRVSCSPGKFLNLDSLKCHFLDFEERFYRILMVRKWHCCSRGYRLSLGPPLGLGAPRVLPVRAHSSYATAAMAFVELVLGEWVQTGANALLACVRVRLYAWNRKIYFKHNLVPRDEVVSSIVKSLKRRLTLYGPFQVLHWVVLRPDAPYAKIRCAGLWPCS
jgi:hypothetical protein